jgi:hypothetical protein
MLSVMFCNIVVLPANVAWNVSAVLTRINYKRNVLLFLIGMEEMVFINCFNGLYYGFELVFVAVYFSCINDFAWYKVHVS